MKTSKRPTAALALGDGTILYGRGFGAEGQAVAELCFNTAMTGYQEIMTDTSYAGQIITFTFPHIGNTGIAAEDNEAKDVVAAGMVVRAIPSAPSNWRSEGGLHEWLEKSGRIGISGVDTRRLTRLIRESGAPHVTLAHNKAGDFDEEALVKAARQFPGLVGADLAGELSCEAPYRWEGMRWKWGDLDGLAPPPGGQRFHVVAIDYGAKHNILRSLATAGCDITVVPADMPAREILAMSPDGVFLTNGPGDPAATARYATPIVRSLIEADLPVFGICLGHQLLALALGAKTKKMHHGHHGANHPVKDISTGRVEITSMNHGFTVDAQTLPAGVSESHISLFDGTNCGLQVDGKPVCSVQHHPEASPGPQDSIGFFTRFTKAMAVRKMAHA